MDKVSSIAFSFFLCVVFSDVLGKPSDLPRLPPSAARSNGRIVGGNMTEMRRAPYQALLNIRRNADFHRCGGSIISEMWILTAAHCVFGSRMTYIRVGSPEADNGGSMYMSNVYLMEPRYDPTSHEYDAAVVFVERGMGLDGVDKSAVKLASDAMNFEPGEMMQVTGYGYTQENGNYSNRMRFADVPLMSNKNCLRAFNDTVRVTDNMACLGGEQEMDVCEGDYGGPAVMTPMNLQYGIASFGKGCGRSGVPSVFTRVSSVRTWVLRVMEEMK